MTPVQLRHAVHRHGRRSRSKQVRAVLAEELPQRPSLSLKVRVKAHQPDRHLAYSSNLLDNALAGQKWNGHRDRAGIKACKQCGHKVQPGREHQEHTFAAQLFRDQIDGYLFSPPVESSKRKFLCDATVKIQKNKGMFVRRYRRPRAQDIADGVRIERPRRETYPR